MNVTELKEKREKLADRIRKMGNDHLASGEVWSSDQEAEFDRLCNEHNELFEQLEVVNRVGKTITAIDEYDHQPNNPHGVGYNHGGEPQLIGDRVPGFTGEKGFEWATGRNGQRVAMVRPEQSYADAVSAAGRDLGSNHGISLGEFLSSLATGPRSDAERNVLSESEPTAGGVTVPTRLAAQLIDIMRAKSRIIEAGARTIPLDTEKTTFAKLVSDPSASWRNELDPIAESDPTFGSVTFTARSLAFKVKVSGELLEDSVNVGQQLPRIMGETMAAEMDRVALAGSGVAPEPMGLLVSGDIPVEPAAAGTPAALSDYTPMLRAVELLSGRNFDGPMAASMHPRTRAQMNRLTDTTGQPLRVPPALENVRMLSTTKVPIDETSGANTDLSSIIVGDFSNLVLGIRSNVRVRVFDNSLQDDYSYTFMTWLRMDVQAFRADAFQRVSEIAA